ncbi:MAG TPA: MFS transporter [bacterium]|nr:MFS transporter [bacterium]
MFQAIYTASFLMAWGGNLLGISLSLFLAQIKQSGPFIIGLAGFTGNFIYTIVTFLLSRHHLKNNTIFIYTTIAIGISYFLILFSPVPIIFVILLLGGIFYAVFWPSIQSCFVATNDDLKIGIYNLFWSAGVILGTFSSGFIYSFSPYAPFFVTLSLSIIAFCVLISKKNHLSALNAVPLQDKNKEQISPVLVKEIRMLNFLHFFAWSAIFYLYPKLGLLRKFSPQFIGTVIGTLLISRFVTFFLLMDKPLILHPARFIISCLFFFISCLLIGLGSHTFIILTAAIVMGITGAFSYHNSLLMHIKYNLKTEIHECVIGAGLFAGSLVAGLLGQILNLPVAYTIIGTFILLVGLVYSRHYIFGLTKRKVN